MAGPNQLDRPYYSARPDQMVDSVPRLSSTNRFGAGESGAVTEYFSSFPPEYMAYSLE